MDNQEKRSIVFKGKSFALEGFAAKPRKIIEEDIQKLGGSVAKKLDRETDYLVCNLLGELTHEMKDSISLMREEGSQLQVISFEEYSEAAMADSKLKARSLSIPSNYQIPEYKYEEREYVRKVNIPQEVIRIGYGAFRDCIRLEEVVLPDSVEVLGGHVFDGCSMLRSIVLPEKVTVLENCVFANCNMLKKVTLGSQVKTIKKGAFLYCTSLEEIILPDTVETIEEGAFSNCIRLKKIHIPSKVKTIHTRTFLGCKALEELLIPGVRTMIDTAIHGSGVETRLQENSDGMIMMNGDFLFKYTGNAEKELKIPKYVKRINEYAFTERLLIVAYHLPIEEIPVFCRKEAMLRFAQESNRGESNYSEEAGKSYHAYIKKKYKELFLEKEMFQYALNHDLVPYLKIEEFSELVAQSQDTEKIAALLEYKNRLSTEENLRKAENKREREETKMFGDIQENSLAILKKTWAFSENEYGIILENYKGKEKEIIIPDMIGNKKVIGIGERCFSPYKPRLKKELAEWRMKHINKIVVPNSVRTIAANAFSNCWALQTLELGNELNTIGTDAVNCCFELKELTLPESMKKIDLGFLGECTAERVRIPFGVQSIVQKGFWDKESTTLIVFAGSYAEQYCKDNNCKYELQEEENERRI